MLQETKLHIQNMISTLNLMIIITCGGSIWRLNEHENLQFGNDEGVHVSSKH